MATDTVYNPQSLRIVGRGADSSIPEGFIKVNDQLQRSQAAPQPIPYWITQADQEAEYRRQRDEAQRQANIEQEDPTGQAAKGIERARQIQGALELGAALKSGKPFMEAFMSAAPLLYYRNPERMSSVARLAMQSQPTTVTEQVLPSGQRVLIGGKQFKFPPAQEVAPGTEVQSVPIRTPEGEVVGQAVRSKGGVVKPLAEKNKGLSHGTELAKYRTQLAEINKDIEAAVGDEATLAPLRETRKALLDTIRDIGVKPQTATPVTKSTKPTTPDKSEARKEAESLIKSRPRIADQVRARFKQTYGEDL